MNVAALVFAGLVLVLPADRAVAQGGGAGLRQPDATPACLTCPAGRPICRTVRSCVEAYFQLRTCGFSGHDRDGDGVPCEVVCGSNNRMVPPIPPRCR